MTPLLLARRLCAERRLRDRLLEYEQLCDRRWAIMLDLFIAREEKRKIPITSAALATHAPRSTALRHIDAMIANRTLRRYKSDVDGRVWFVELTDEAHHTMARLLEQMAPIER